MNNNLAPTKANLIKAKGMLGFSEKGFELLDKKRSVLIREMLGLVDRATKIQTEIQEHFDRAYRALKTANITMGFSTVEEISISIKKQESYDVLQKSVMGVEIPIVKYKGERMEPVYSIFRSNAALDEAVMEFTALKGLIYELAEVENSVYRLAMEIKKTQKRANALEKIQIPKYTWIVKNIEEILEEKEREDFFRLKKIKSKGDNSL